MADDVRKRTAATAPDTKEEDEIEEQEERESDPLVASLDADQARQGGADYWDLDDDGDWGGSSQPSASAHRRVLRRSTFEMGVAFVCHLVLMCYYIIVHVYDSIIFKQSKGIGFEGAFTYGGRWKYLTYINLWVQFLYFFLCFFVDIMPYGATKVWFRKVCDVMFTTIAFPLTIFVAVMFWGIYAINREFIYPLYLDKTIPFLMNHCWHTLIVVAVLIELVVVFHQLPSNWTAAIVTFGYSMGYMVWIVWVFNMSRKWPYPFMSAIPLPLLPLFFLTCSFIGLGFYFLGKGLCYIRWRERHRVLAQIAHKNS